jgi:hypothetical protein
LNFAMRRRAAAEAKAGDLKKAARTLDAMPKLFEAKGVKPEVVATVRRQAEKAKADILG